MPYVRCFLVFLKQIGGNETRSAPPAAAVSFYENKDKAGIKNKENYGKAV